MTSSETNPISALSGLLEERRRYEGWLAQLEARRTESPAHVVDRVRSDYQSRLEGVTQQLRGRASDLEKSVAALREQIAALLTEENGRRDERYELELRALVGEYEPDRARDSMSACDEAITRLTAERGGLEAELARITQVLALVAPPSAPEPAHVEERPEDERADTVARAGDSTPDEAPAADRPDAAGDERGSALATSSLLPPEPSPMDELAFLQSVVDSPRADSTRESAARDSAARAANDEGTSSSRGEGRADLLPPPVLTALRRPATPLSTSIPTTRDALRNPSNPSSLTPGSMPSFLKDMPTEQVKTLKCQECGTMNYPTEWYCERCGGELAAM